MSRNLADSYADVDPDSFGRPARRTRPRTKDRPDYSDAQLGRVITVDRGRFRCQMVVGGQMVSATKARHLGRKGVIVGDVVRMAGDTSGDEGTLARIVEVIVRDQRAILTVCTPTDEVVGIQDVTVSLPRLTGGKGIIATLPLHLSAPETEALRQSAQIIREAIDAVEHA